MKNNLLATRLSRALACAMLAPASTIAIAQTATTTPDGALEAKQLDTIVVQAEIAYRDRTDDIAPVLFLRPGVLPALRTEHRRRHAQARARRGLRRFRHHGVRRRAAARPGGRLHAGADQRQEGAGRRRRPLVLGGPHPGRNGRPHRDPAQQQRQSLRRRRGRCGQHRAARCLRVRRQLRARRREPLGRRRDQPHLRRRDQRRRARRPPPGRRQRAGPLPLQDQALRPLQRSVAGRTGQLRGPDRSEGWPRLLGQPFLHRRRRRNRTPQHRWFLRQDRSRRHRGFE